MEVRHPPPPNTHFSYKALRQQLFHDPASESWTLRVSAEDDCRPVLTSHSQSTRICQSFLYPFEMCLAIQEYLSSGLGNHILKWNHPEKWSHVSLFHGGGGAQQMANPRASLSQHLKSASLQHNMASQKPLPLPSMPACAGMPPPSPLYSEWPNKPPNPEANTGFRHSVLGDLLQSEF